MTTETDVVVVGGGLAGLTAATILARGGRKVRVLERSEALGGRAASQDVHGFKLNVGAHALYRTGVGRAVLRELGVAVAGGVPSGGGAYAVRAGRAHTLPVGALSLLATGLLGFTERLEAARFLASLSRLDVGSAEGRSLADWIEARRMSPVLRELLEALVRVSTYVDAPSRLSAAAALRQLQLAATGGVLYLHGGWQTLVDGLASAARGAGVEIETGASVKRVEPRADGVEVQLEGGRRRSARAVVAALAPGAALSLVAGARPVAVEASRAACLDLALQRLPRPRTRFALGIDRPLYFSVHSNVAALAPAGGALVHLIRYGADGAPGDRAELEGLMDLVQPGWRSQVVHARFLPEMTVTHAIAPPEGGLAGRPDVDALGVDNVLVAGDWVGPEGMLADAALASARRAALRLLGAGARTQRVA